MPRRLRALILLLSFALLVSLTVVTGVGSSVRKAEAAPPPGLPALLPLHATRTTKPGIYDSAGRQVILRGVNLNTLGDYYQANVAYPPTFPYLDSDFAEMAAEGFNVVRLLLSWSLLEPTKGTIDGTYLAKVHKAVDAAKANGLYVVIDMHQDAWGKYIASPPGVVCPAGLSPAIGWDGAPEWATITGGAETCTDGSREKSEAAMTAWDNFWADTAGIQTELVNVWGRLGTEFADEPAVAGYDLLNEPNPGHNNAAAKTELGLFSGRAIAAIRASENATAGSFHHIAFFETTIYGGVVPITFTDDTNVVFAPHNYGESLNAFTIEGLFGFFRGIAVKYGTTMWTGEYGWFGDPPNNKSKAIRFAVKEDALITAGSTWWQWEQSCGDPHSIGSPNGTPSALLIHFKATGCPGNVDLGPVPEWAIVLSRPLVRGAPGQLSVLVSDGDTATMHLIGDPAGATPAASAGAQLDLWVPDHATGGDPATASLGITAPIVTGTGIANVVVVAVPGGWRVFADVCGPYDLTIAVAGTVVAAAPASCNPVAPTTTVAAVAFVAATPVVATPAFTG